LLETQLKQPISTLLLYIDLFYVFVFDTA